MLVAAPHSKHHALNRLALLLLTLTLGSAMRATRTGPIRCLIERALVVIKGLSSNVSFLESLLTDL
jgi:hypothetical protein